MQRTVFRCVDGPQIDSGSNTAGRTRIPVRAVVLRIIPFLGIRSICIISVESIIFHFIILGEFVLPYYWLVTSI